VHTHMSLFRDVPSRSFGPGGGPAGGQRGAEGTGHR
jgi:hypothetical protein